MDLTQSEQPEFGKRPKGTRLSREFSQRLRHHGISPRAISGSTTIIPKETSFRGWDDGKFWGFNAALAHRVQDHFKANNNLFAQAAWDRPWNDVFVHDNGLLNRPENSFCPQDPRKPSRCTVLPIIFYCAFIGARRTAACIGCESQSND